MCVFCFRQENGRFFVLLIRSRTSLFSGKNCSNYEHFLLLIRKVHYLKAKAAHECYYFMCQNLPFQIIMHHSFVTTPPKGPGNSGDIYFSLCKARVYAQHSRESLMVKALPKGLSKSQHLNVKLVGSGMESKSLPFHGTAGMMLRSKLGT